MRVSLDERFRYRCSGEIASTLSRVTRDPGMLVMGVSYHKSNARSKRTLMSTNQRKLALIG